jgi:capsular polysaccharide transport system permease protein
MALQILTLGVVLSLFNNGQPPIGDQLFFFYATGVMPFYLFIHVIDNAQNQFLDKANILQVPIITRLDVVLAVAITELLIMTAVIVVTFGTFSLISYGPPSDNQIQCVFAMLAVWLFAFGLGLICAVMTNLYRGWANGWLIVQRFLYIASGVFFIPLNMPAWVREPLSWNGSAPASSCVTTRRGSTSSTSWLLRLRPSSSG